MNGKTHLKSAGLGVAPVVSTLLAINGAIVGRYVLQNPFDDTETLTYNLGIFAIDAQGDFEVTNRQSLVVALAMPLGGSIGIVTTLYSYYDFSINDVQD